MENKILLGKVRKDFRADDNQSYIGGELLYLTKHSWDCDWYWGMGYIGNKDLHCHFDNQFLRNPEYAISNIFESTNIKQSDWWIILDLFKQAYALQAAAEIYIHGGHMTSKKNVTDIVHSDEMAASINKDLSKVLDKLWEYLEGVNKGV